MGITLGFNDILNSFYYLLIKLIIKLTYCTETSINYFVILIIRDSWYRDSCVCPIAVKKVSNRGTNGHCVGLEIRLHLRISWPLLKRGPWNKIQFETKFNRLEEPKRINSQKGRRLFFFATSLKFWPFESLHILWLAYLNNFQGILHSINLYPHLLLLLFLFVVLFMYWLTWELLIVCAGGGLRTIPGISLRSSCPAAKEKYLKMQKDI